jgi:hypothetical protein
MATPAWQYNTLVIRGSSLGSQQRSLGKKLEALAADGWEVVSVAASSGSTQGTGAPPLEHQAPEHVVEILVVARRAASKSKR